MLYTAIAPKWFGAVGSSIRARKAGGRTLVILPSNDAVKWEFVIDNNSGTYAPDKMLLPEVKELFEFNFPGLVVHALDREDERLVESGEACRAYALKWRGPGRGRMSCSPMLKRGRLHCVGVCRRVGSRRVQDRFKE
jgi:hypothetical protein